MYARIVTIAAAALLASTSVNAAEPVKKPVPEAKQPEVRSSPVILASADQLSPEGASSAAPPPVKHRAGRITTCRCGGDPQQPQPEEQQ